MEPVEDSCLGGRPRNLALDVIPHVAIAPGLGIVPGRGEEVAEESLHDEIRPHPEGPSITQGQRRAKPTADTSDEEC